MSEHDEQAAFITWCAHQVNVYPELERLFAIPNGGHRNKVTAGKMKAEGVRAGVPDLFLPVPSGGYNGLFMELKIKPNKPSAAQVEWLEFLEAQGYAAHICWSFEELVESVEWYLSLGADVVK